MKKIKRVVLALVLALVMAMPTTAIARPLDEVQQRIATVGAEGDVIVFVPLRLTAYAHDWTVEWDGDNRAVHLTGTDGVTVTVMVDAVGGFIEDGTTWVPYYYAVELFGVASAIDAGAEAEEVVTNFMANLTPDKVNNVVAAMIADNILQGLSALISDILMRRGDVIDVSVLNRQYVQGRYAFDIAAMHTKGSATYRVFVDNGLVGGFLMLDYFNFQPMMPPENAPYVAEAVVVGEGTSWPLDGLLTLPKGASAENPVPAVVLVHGSGPNNMDSSVFNNRPFFDIADYLSSNGIAVLRYNERMFTHGAQFLEVFGEGTIWDEKIESALQASDILRADERISDVFVLGLSKGAGIAPRIAEEGGFDGAIMMNGSPRPMFEWSHDQSVRSIEDLLREGIITQEIADISLASAAAMLEEARDIHNLTPEELADATISGMSGIYQMSIIESLPLPFISSNNTPVLILHGSRDFQTTVDDDFSILVEYTQGMSHVTTILYEGLNHLMMTAYRQGGPLVVDVMEYAIPDRVDRQVLRDIVEWVSKIAESHENYIPYIAGNFSFEVPSRIESDNAVLLGRIEIERGVTYNFDLRFGINMGNVYIGLASSPNKEDYQASEYEATWLQLISPGHFTSDEDMRVYVYIVVPEGTWVADVWGGIYSINDFPSPQPRSIPDNMQSSQRN